MRRVRHLRGRLPVFLAILSLVVGVLGVWRILDGPSDQERVEDRAQELGAIFERGDDLGACRLYPPSFYIEPIDEEDYRECAESVPTIPAGYQHESVDQVEVGGDEATAQFHGLMHGREVVYTYRFTKQDEEWYLAGRVRD